jgi:hypothetical protein
MSLVTHWCEFATEKTWVEYPSSGATASGECADWEQTAPVFKEPTRRLFAGSSGISVDGPEDIEDLGLILGEAWDMFGFDEGPKLKLLLKKPLNLRFLLAFSAPPVALIAALLLGNDTGSSETMVWSFSDMPSAFLSDGFCCRCVRVFACTLIGLSRGISGEEYRFRRPIRAVSDIDSSTAWDFLLSDVLDRRAKEECRPSRVPWWNLGGASRKSAANRRRETLR